MIGSVRERVLVIGGGVSGLSASVDLVMRGIPVYLFEARPFLGGRIYSFRDPSTGEELDNGMHLVAGFYRYFMRFLSNIGRAGSIEFGPRLEVVLADGKKRFRFRTCGLPSPLNLVCGLLRYRPFPKRDILLLSRCLRRFRRGDDLLEGMSAGELLTSFGISREAIRYFFRPLILSTLNAEAFEVASTIFVEMLRSILASRSSEVVLGHSTIPYSSLIAGPAANFITSRGGKIYLSSRVLSIRVEGDRVVSILDSQNREVEAFAYILAVPPHEASLLLPHLREAGEWDYSPIVSVDVWLREGALRLIDEEMIGLTDGEFHWVFNRCSMVDGSRHITLLASGARDMMGRDKEDLIGAASRSLKELFGIGRRDIEYARVIKERRATPLIAPGKNRARPPSRTRFKNLFLAGDWTSTGLPPTLESAAMSGFSAAEGVMELINGGAG